jgi:hypothetical protein
MAKKNNADILRVKGNVRDENSESGDDRVCQVLGSEILASGKEYIADCVDRNGLGLSEDDYSDCEIHFVYVGSKWIPVQEYLKSVKHPVLKQKKNYRSGTYHCLNDVPVGFVAIKGYNSVSGLNLDFACTKQVKAHVQKLVAELMQLADADKLIAITPDPNGPRNGWNGG